MYISHNLLSSICGLDSNLNLRVLDVSNNPIEKLEGVRQLERLEEFWASNCRLGSFEDVKGELGGLGRLETVYLEGNPLESEQRVLYRGKVRLALPGVRKVDASEFGFDP